MARILPGVEIKVVKEIIPPAAYPSGVVALMGTAEKGPELAPKHVSSWKEYVGIYGDDTRYSMTSAARLCFLNGVFEVVAMRLVGTGGAAASINLKDAGRKNTVELTAREIGEAGNGIKIKVENGTAENSVRLSIVHGSVIEFFDNLVMDPKSEFYLVKYVNEHSKLVTAKDLKSASVFPKNNPVVAEVELKGGKDPGPPSKKTYEAALEHLEAESDVDIVLACDSWDPEVHALVEAHCRNMSGEAMGRIGIGTVGPGEKIEDIVKRTEKLSSDRFVLVAPYGVAAAVAGLISRLDYYESPTYKRVSGISELERYYTPSQLRQLLKAGILPLQAQRGRGIIVVKGITTSNEQINVMRTTDHAVKLVKGISDQFIGTLNNASGRSALKEKITELMLRMEREGAIVPSTDGEQPAFMVDVYSSQLDFAQGIVRVDLAVRPVRAIDYIYATIVVQA